MSQATPIPKPTRRMLLPPLLLALAAGCTTSTPIEEYGDGGPGEVTPPGTTVSELVGTEGATLEAEGTVVEIPPGALSEPTEITVTVTEDPVPAGFAGYSPVYRFEPEGLSFDRPVRVELPFRGDASVASIFWTRPTGPGYVAMGTSVEGQVASAEVQHFSQAFVGTDDSCQSGACCTRATGELDVLFVVDNSNSMGEEQVSLAEQLPRMARALATGDVDGDGEQDFPAVSSLHVGVVSTDMGTGGFTVPTCADSVDGDDGILRTEGNTAVAGCLADYPSFLTYEADGSDDPDAFAADVRCVARMGTGGCGFEQQLEASLKAVLPSDSAIVGPGEDQIAPFVVGQGHGDTDNGGFLREGSVLAVVQITDEDDCSASDPELFDPDSTTYEGDLNLRCFQYPEATFPVERYAKGLMSLRDQPSRLVFASIVGVPVDLVGTDPSSADYDAILSDARMQQRIDPDMPTRLEPSCEVPDRGVAFPPRRIVRTAQQLDSLGAGGVVQSICQEDFSPAVDAILGQVADGLAGVCR